MTNNELLEYISQLKLQIDVYDKKLRLSRFDTGEYIHLETELNWALLEFNPNAATLLIPNPNSILEYISGCIRDDVSFDTIADQLVESEATKDQLKAALSVARKDISLFLMDKKAPSARFFNLSPTLQNMHKATQSLKCAIDTLTLSEEVVA